MAVIICKNCGFETGSEMKRCHKCQSPIKKKTSVFTWLVTILIIFFVIISFSGRSNNDSAISVASHTKDTSKLKTEKPIVKDKKEVVVVDTIDNAMRLCSVFNRAEILSKPCSVSGWNQSIDITIGTSPSEARKICNNTVKMMSAEGAVFDKGWKIRIYSPFSNGETIAFCELPTAKRPRIPDVIFNQDIRVCNENSVKTGKTYTVKGLGVNVRTGPGVDFDKVKNKKASNILNKIVTITVDNSVTVMEECSQGKWSRIKVTIPKSLSSSHQGWIASDFLLKLDKPKDTKWKAVDLFDHVGIIRTLAIKHIRGCGDVKKVYQYNEGNIFNVYCDPARKWYSVDVVAESVMKSSDPRK